MAETIKKFLDQEGVKVLWEQFKEHSPKRNNDFNYRADFVPYKGQICFVDTSKNGLQVKIGDGITAWQDLNFLTATDQAYGLIKMYDSLGQNEDGTMTQKKITEELLARYKTSVEESSECLVFSL